MHAEINSRTWKQARSVPILYLAVFCIVGAISGVQSSSEALPRETISKQ